MASAEAERMFDALRRHPLDPARTPVQHRADLQALAARRPPPEGVRITELDAAGIRSEMVEPTGAEATGRTILHLHGGGFVMGSAATVRPFAAALARCTGSTVVVPEYALAPERPFPAALHDAVHVYRALTDPAGPALVLSGDSAGGGLAIATAVTARDAGLPSPAAITCVSPWVDLRRIGDDGPDDPTASPAVLRSFAAAYLAGQEPEDPRVSPVLANLAGLPPLLVQAGSNDLLVRDGEALVVAALAAGVDATFQVWPDMVHAFSAIAPTLPESELAIGALAAWLDGVVQPAGAGR
jgi:acetyl esterase/lipase